MKDSAGTSFLCLLVPLLVSAALFYIPTGNIAALPARKFTRYRVRPVAPLAVMLIGGKRRPASQSGAKSLGLTTRMMFFAILLANCAGEKTIGTKSFFLYCASPLRPLIGANSLCSVCFGSASSRGALNEG